MTGLLVVAIVRMPTFEAKPSISFRKNDRFSAEISESRSSRTSRHGEASLARSKTRRIPVSSVQFSDSNVLMYRQGRPVALIRALMAWV